MLLLHVSASFKPSSGSFTPYRFKRTQNTTQRIELHYGSKIKLRDFMQRRNYNISSHSFLTTINKITVKYYWRFVAIYYTF